jgi:hypothetical protein
MPGQPTQTGANRMLDAVSGRATATSFTAYLALATSAPTDTALGTELTTPGSNGYSRQTCAWDASTGDPSSMDNTSLITFGPFSSDLGNVTHIMLMDVSTGGTATNCLWYWSADVAKDPANGDSITIAAGALVMTAD